MEKINKITFSPLDLILELKEYKNKISFINQTNDSKIQKLLYFFQNISQIYSSFGNIPLNFSEDSYGNIQFSLNLQDFYSFHNEFFNSISNSSKKMKEEIISPLENFSKTINRDYLNNISTLELIISSLETQNERIDKLKKSYYQEYEIVEKMEKESIKTANSNMSNQEINNLHEKLLKQREIMENKSLLYRKEINIANQLYLEYENNFRIIFNDIEQLEEKKRTFIRSIIDNYLKLFHNSLTWFNGMINMFKNNINQYNIPKDIKDFSNDSIKNNISLQNKWNIFSFQSYDKYKSELNQIININEMNYEEEDDALKGLIQGIGSGNLMNIECIEKISSETPEFDIFNEKHFQENYISTSEYEETTIKNFCSSILSQNNIFDDLLNKILSLINKSDEKFFVKFFQIFLNQKKNRIFFKFLNFLNLAHFNNVIMNIIANLNLDDIKSVSYELLYTIILLSEQSYFENTYLCALLYKNKFFRDKNSWIKLIESRIVKKLNNKIKSYVKQNSNQYLFFKRNNAFNHIITNFFQLNKNYIIESTDLYNYLIDYEKTSIEERKDLNEKDTPKIIHSVMKDFINHMCNLNFGLEQSSELVMEICSKYKLKIENINFYVLYLNTSFYTIRTQFQDKEKNNKTNEKIKELYSLNTYTLQIKYPCSLLSDKEVIIILKNVGKYFQDKELINIFYLNKYTSKNLIQKIYKQRLSDDKISLKKRIRIWKAYLKTEGLKRIYNYLNIKKDIQNKIIKTKYDSLIELDVRRTNFKNQKESNRIIIEYILKALSHSATKVGYCQGMNYIASFLIEIIQNEEEVFYIMLSLLTNTDFMDIFIGDLNKLKIFFYILEKLIYLKLPEIYECLKFNNIAMNFFSSPYFITLFTNIYPNFNEIENKVLIKAWDVFILQGWKSFFSSLLAILQYNKEGILNCKGDELMTYLISTMAKSDIFKSQNVEIFCKLRKQFKVTLNILKNLEEEIGIESGIKNINLNGFISKESSDDNKL